MSNDLDAIFSQNTENVETPKDFVGGGGYLKDSDVYLMKVKHAFMEKSKGGAIGFNISMKHADEKKTEFNQTIYISTKAETGCKFTYHKNGKDNFLPGYILVNDMCLIASDGKYGVAANKQLNCEEAPRSTKTVEVYDYEQGKKMPKEVQVIDCLEGAIFNIGLVKKKKNKWSSGAPTAEVKESNEVNKVYSKDRKSVSEIKAGAPGTHIDTWIEKNQGVIIDEYKEVATSASSHSAASSGDINGAAAADNDDDIFGDED